MQQAEQIYNKYLNGDSLTDDELVVGIKHFTELEALCRRAGPVFRLPAYEAYRVHAALSAFQRARKEKK